MNYYTSVLKKYAVFSGRASRKEFWMFILFNLIFGIVAMILDNVLGIAMKGANYGPIYLLYILAIILPCLAVEVRRLHDTGRSGSWWFIVLIPFVGPICFLVLMCLDSNLGENKYGKNPKEIVVTEQVSQ